MPDALSELPGETQVRGERHPVVEQAGDRGGEELLVLGGEGVDAGLHEVDHSLAGHHLLGHIEELPAGLLQLGLDMFWRLGTDIPRPVDEAALAQCLEESPFEGVHQAGGNVGYDEQPALYAAGPQVLQEAVPGVVALVRSRGQADESGLRLSGDAPGGEQRRGLGALVALEVRAVQEPVVEVDVGQGAGCPGVVVVFYRLADTADGGTWTGLPPARGCRRRQLPRHRARARGQNLR